MIITLVWNVIHEFANQNSYYKFNNYYFDRFLVMALVFISSWLISTRSVSSFPDTYNYISFFDAIEIGELESALSARFEKGFSLFSYFVKIAYADVRFLFFIVTVSFWMSALNLAKFALGKRFLIFATFLFLLWPFVITLNANVMRQAICSAFLFLAYFFILKERFQLSLIFSLIAILFHWVSLLFLPFYWFAKKSKLLATCSRKKILFFWIVLSLVSSTGLIKIIIDLIMQLFSVIAGDYYSQYLRNDRLYNIGFRIDFWLFSSIPILILLIYQRCLGAKGVILNNIALYWGVVHIGLFDIPYSDRVGVNAWILYPIILALVLNSLKGRLKIMSYFLSALILISSPLLTYLNYMSV